MVSGLWANDFNYPSPIQIRAIPLAKSGLDLFIQAKSGTGKTLVFAITILERFIASNESSKTALTSLVIAPTREIVVQVQKVISEMGQKVKGFKAIACIGGIDIEKDRKQISGANCLVGSPGRVLHLIRNKYVNPSKIELFVLDEADQLMTDSFKKDVFAIADELNKRQQTLVVSATFDSEIEKVLYPLMSNPLGVTPKKEAPVLHGITQFMFMLPKAENILEEMRLKVEQLDTLLREINYNQCLIFTNSQSRAESYSNMLLQKGFVADFITGAQDQNTRLRTFERIMVAPNCRLIITTDLLARGIDAERVNVVINLELPSDQFCYLHRIGRAGRFGSLGIAITFVSEGEELMKFKNILLSEEFPVYKMTLENAKDTLDVLETGKVPETYEALLPPDRTKPKVATVENSPDDSPKPSTSQQSEESKPEKVVTDEPTPDDADSKKESKRDDQKPETSEKPKKKTKPKVSERKPFYGTWEDYEKLAPGVSEEEANGRPLIDLMKNPMEVFEVYEKFKKGEYTLDNMPLIKKLPREALFCNIEEDCTGALPNLITRDILDKKSTLEQMTVASSNEPVEGSSSYKANLEDSFSEPDSKGMFSTTTNFDSDSTHDNICESEVNSAANDPGNLNTESVNEKVDAFLEGLQECPEDDDLQEPSIADGAVAPETATVNGDVSEAPETVQEVVEASAGAGVFVRDDNKIDSGSESDDEESFDDSDRDSNASIRGSNSFTNGIGSSDEDEEDYFDGDYVVPPSGQLSSQRYRSAYNMWTSIYWNQASQIQDYVNYVRYVKQAATGRRQ